MERSSVLVIGIGNPLVGDEGVGVRVAAELADDPRLPAGVEVIDAGTMGMSILPLLQRSERVIVVDAVDDTGHPPGTVVRMCASDLADNQVFHSLHDLRFSDVLAAARLIGAEPAAEFIGVQVRDMETGVLWLTPEVEAAVPRAVEAVLESLGR